MNYTFSDELFSDLHKDCYGFRPGYGGFTNWDLLSDNEKQEWWDRMVSNLNAREETESKERADREAALEERIAQEMKEGNLTRREWLLVELDKTQSLDDPDFLCYRLGIAYGYFKNDFAHE